MFIRGKNSEMCAGALDPAAQAPRLNSTRARAPLAKVFPLQSSLMIIRRFLLALLLLVVPARADFTFIHCSDVHYGVGDNHETDAALYREIAALERWFEGVYGGK